MSRTEDTDRLTAIASFRQNAEAELVRTFMASRGIDCVLNDTLSNQLLGGYVDMGGIQMLVLESRADEARAVMREGGFEEYLL